MHSISKKIHSKADNRITRFNEHAEKLDSFVVLTLDFSEEGILEDVIYQSNLRSYFFIISVIMQGTVTLKLNLQEYILKKNDLFFIAPDATIEFISISNDVILKTVANSTDFLLNMPLPENIYGNGRIFYI